jgi:hypothetical protein
LDLGQHVYHGSVLQALASYLPAFNIPLSVVTF